MVGNYTGICIRIGIKATESLRSHAAHDFKLADEAFGSSCQKRSLDTNDTAQKATKHDHLDRLRQWAINFKRFVLSCCMNFSKCSDGSASLTSGN